jgi:O-antigen/teichoic acid export membrane protein
VVFSQGIQVGTQIVSLVLLSRLLPPSAFGVVAMVSAITGLVGVLSGFGLSLSALAGDKPSFLERSNLFWINAAAGVLCMVVADGCAPLVASFYRNPALIGITFGLAVAFVPNALAVQFKIELTLERRWSRLVIVQAVPGLVALCVAAVIAAVTSSAWSLVIQGIVSSGMSLLLAVWLSGWRPVRPQRDSRLRRHLIFGRDTAVIQTLNYVASNADNALVGRVLGRTVLGEYNRAYSLVLLPLNQLAVPLEQVILPRLSAALNDDFDEVTLRCQRAMVYVQLVPLSLIAGTAYPLVRVFLGSRWLAVPELMQIQAIGAAASAVGYIYWWMLLVKRRSGMIVLSEGAVEILMVIGMALVVRTGSSSVAWCVAAGQVVMLINTALLCRRILGVKLLPLARISSTALELTAAAAICANYVGRMRWWPSSYEALVVALVAWTIVFCAGWFISPSVRNDMRVVVDILKSARR